MLYATAGRDLGRAVIVLRMFSIKLRSWRSPGVSFLRVGWGALSRAPELAKRVFEGVADVDGRGEDDEKQTEAT